MSILLFLDSILVIK